MHSQMASKKFLFGHPAIAEYLIEMFRSVGMQRSAKRAGSRRKTMSRSKCMLCHKLFAHDYSLWQVPAISLQLVTLAIFLDWKPVSHSGSLLSQCQTLAMPQFLCINPLIVVKSRHHVFYIFQTQIDRVGGTPIEWPPKELHSWMTSSSTQPAISFSNQAWKREIQQNEQHLPLACSASPLLHDWVRISSLPVL